LFKALLVASVAMLACCAAAALAGPVHPATNLQPAVAVIAIDDLAGDLSPLQMIPATVDDSPPTLLDSFAADTFNPSISLSATHNGAVATAAANVAALEPTAQPAVIPLPAPLYAGVALLALTLITRRKILRAC